MKILTSTFLFLLTSFLFTSSFYLALCDNSNWIYFLSVGVFSLIITSSVAVNLSNNHYYEEEEKNDNTRFG